MSTEQIKKRHHYISECYLRSFADESERIWEFRKDDPRAPHHQRYSEVGHHKHYYAQPLPDGGTDHNTLENFWSEIETKWTPLVAQIREREDITSSRADLYRFLTMCRVRVPAARDLFELKRAEEVRATIQQLDLMGRLPPKPEGLRDILDKIEISIDPHQSIHAMAPIAAGFGQILARVGYEIVVNDTDVEFVTSDNPVVYFDPRTPDDLLRPYTVDPRDWCVEFLFPIDPKHCLHAHSDLGFQFLRDGITYRRASERTEIKRINRLVVKFGYKSIYSKTTAIAPAVRKYAEQSPVGKARRLSRDGKTLLVLQQEFGSRHKKPKWKRAS